MTGNNPTSPQPVPVNYDGKMTVPINGEGGKLYGIEVAGTLPLSSFTQMLERRYKGQEARCNQHRRRVGRSHSI